MNIVVMTTAYRRVLSVMYGTVCRLVAFRSLLKKECLSVASVGHTPSLILCSRWIRLLFSREFPFLTTLDLWDAIFAEGNTLEIVDYLYVAMLINIKGQREWG